MISTAAIASFQSTRRPIDRQAFVRRDELEVGKARGRNAVLSPAMDGRRWSVGETRYGGGAAESVDYSVCDGRHVRLHAIVAKSNQEVFCDIRDCDNRRGSLHDHMDIEEIRSWADAQRGRREQLAIALGISSDKVSKSLSPKGTRQFTAREMDIVRDFIRRETGQTRAGTRAIPLLSSVPGGNWREAIRSPSGSIPVPDDSVPPNAYALTVEGDSMDLLAPDGSTVILDPEDLDLYPKRYYVVRNESGEITFKQFLADPARLAPCSSNPAHTDIVLGRGQFEIIARVTGVYRSI